MEGVLRRAQYALLNPDENVDWFLDLDDASVHRLKKGILPSKSKKKLSFTSSTVCIDISGPNVVDLVSIDLPVLLALLVIMGTRMI